MSLRRSNLQPVIATLFIGSLLILVLHGQIAAQIDVAPKRGVYQTGSYSASGFETINNTNGNVMFNLPLASLPGGRGGMSYGISLSYNSKLFDLTTNQFFVPPPGYPGLVMQAKRSETAGWQYGVGYKLEQKKRPVVPEFHNNNSEICHSPANPYYKYFDMYKFVMTMPDGSQKEFMPVLDFGSSVYDSLNQDGYHSVDINGKYRRWSDIYVLGDWMGCEINYHQYTGGMTFYTTDGSQLRLDVAHDGDTDWTNNTWTLKMPDGSRITQAAPLPNENNGRQRIYDQNSNYVEIQKPNATVTSEIVQVTDQLGRSLIIDKNPQTLEDVVTVKGVNNADLNWTVKWKNIGVSREYWMSEDRTTVPQPSVAGGIFKVIDEIILPLQLGGQSYKFDYNGNPNGDVNTTSHGFGEISRVEFPSGAVTEYEYKLDGVPPDIPEWTDVFLNSIASKKLTYQDEYDGQTSPQEEDWIYDITRTQATITAPDGGVSYSYHNDWFEDVGTYTTFAVGGGVAGNSVSPDGSVSLRNYIGMNNSIFYSPVPFPTSLVGSEFTAIADSSGNPSLAAIKTYNYDLNGNLLRVKEYDWVPYSSVTFSNGQIVVPPGAILKRVTENTYYNPTPEYDPNLGFNQGANQPNAYYKRSSARTLSALKSTEIKTGTGTPVSRSEFVYDDLVNKGNLIETKTWDSFKGGTNQPHSNPLNGSNSISSTVQYDQYGNPVLMTDAKGVQTQIVYGDIATANGTVNGLYPTQTVAAYGTPLARTSTAVYDFYTGLVTSATDVDNGVTSAIEYDDLGRPLKSIAAVGTLLEIWTRTEYDDINRRVIVRSDLETKGDGKKVAVQHFDQLGRVRLSRSIENIATEDPYNETHGIKVQTRYQTGNPNSYQLTSNPFRAATATGATNEPTMGWTRSMSVNTGRHSETESFSGASLPAPWGSNTTSTGKVQTDTDANATTVTDQAGKQRRNISNALGQLIRVDEPNTAGQLGTVASPNQPTHYSYNTLGKMVKVNQGVQNRYFMYDSLGRMLRVRQPEQEVNTSLATSGNPENNSWSAGFTYDNNGNVLSATDAENTEITNTYDALNRALATTYSDGTPTVTNYYDGTGLPSVPANSKGKLTKVSSSISESKYVEFDIVGRLKQFQQYTDGQTYTSKYTYNLSGALVEEEYPSGRKVRNDFDTDGQLSKVDSKKAGTDVYRPYVSNFAYNAAGMVSQMKYGNGRWETAKFNARLQATELGLGNSATDASVWKTNYEYGELQTNGTVDTVKNSGNIAKQTLTVPGTNFVQSYKYDSVYRLTEAVEKTGATQNWMQQFGYDRYGNRTSFSQDIGGITNNTTPAVDVNTNRFTSSDFGYDKNGNIVEDIDATSSLPREFIFNGDNKQVEVKKMV